MRAQQERDAMRDALVGLRAQVRTATLVDVPDGKAFLLALQAANAVLGETAPGVVGAEASRSIEDNADTLRGLANTDSIRDYRAEQDEVAPGEDE